MPSTDLSAPVEHKTTVETEHFRVEVRSNIQDGLIDTLTDSLDGDRTQGQVIASLSAFETGFYGKAEIHLIEWVILPGSEEDDNLAPTDRSVGAIVGDTVITDNSGEIGDQDLVSALWGMLASVELDDSRTLNEIWDEWSEATA